MEKVTLDKNNFMLYSEYINWHRALMCDDVVVLQEYLERSGDIGEKFSDKWQI